MADILLPTSAVPGEGAYSIPGRAGATLAQGQIVFKNTSRKMALANAAAGVAQHAVGMVQESATINAPINVQTQGHVTGLSGLTAGTFYYLSDGVAGDICLIGDLAAGSRVVQIGYAISATELVLNIVDTGVTL